MSRLLSHESELLHEAVELFDELHHRLDRVARLDGGQAARCVFNDLVALALGQVVAPRDRRPPQPGGACSCGYVDRASGGGSSALSKSPERGLEGEAGRVSRAGLTTARSRL